MASDKFVGPMTAPVPLLKRLVTLTAQLNESGGTFLTEAEANALYLKQASNLSDLSDVAAARTSLGLSVLATTVPGTGIAAALAANVGSAGAPVLFNGALGTPSSGTLTNTTGFPAANLAGTALPAAIVTSSLTTVGALNSGSITSGFGSIDIGADSITAGAASFTTVTASATDAVFSATGGTTNSRYLRLANTTGDIYFGVNNSTGSAFGVSAYDGVIYSVTPLSISINGTVSRWQSTGLSVTGTGTFSNSLILADGTLGTGTMALYFANDTNTGIYRGGADDVRIVAGGTTRAAFTTLGTTFGSGALGSYTLNIVGSGATSCVLAFLDTSNSDKEWRIDQSSGLLRFIESGVAERLSIGASIVALPVYNQTTGSAANVFVDSTGELKRSTSSLRYKDLLGDYDRGLADTLKLRPVYFTDKGGGPRHAGFAAEDVHKAGLTEFVLYDKEGRPDALAYPHMVALTVAALHDVDAHLKSLRARVAALEDA